MTFNQLTKRKHFRKPKINFTRCPKLQHNPHRKGIVMQVTTIKPRKPNSAIRKIAKVTLLKYFVYKKTIRQKIIAYIPGIGGGKLQKFAKVLIRGGRVPDLPGVKYHIIRNKYDFITNEGFNRKNRRSKFSVLNEKKRKKKY